MESSCKLDTPVKTGLNLDQPSTSKVSTGVSVLYLSDALSDTGPRPEIGTVGLDCNARYLILSLDLDVVFPGTGIQTVILHWYQSNFTFDCNESGNSKVLAPGKEDGSSHTAPYIAPQPPPGTNHRYVFLLFDQPQSYEFPECFAHIPPQTKDARSGFNVREFILAAGLDPPVAINYFYGRREPSHERQPMPSLSVTQTFFKSLDCQIDPTAV